MQDVHSGNETWQCMAMEHPIFMFFPPSSLSLVHLLWESLSTEGSLLSPTISPLYQHSWLNPHLDSQFLHGNPQRNHRLFSWCWLRQALKNCGTAQAKQLVTEQSLNRKTSDGGSVDPRATDPTLCKPSAYGWVMVVQIGSNITIYHPICPPVV